jgi:hypothetical protein
MSEIGEMTSNKVYDINDLSVTCAELLERPRRVRPSQLCLIRHLVGDFLKQP